MPSKSKAQHNLMAMVAHDPKAAKRLGIPQSVGRDYVEADKGRKFGSGGSMKESKAMMKKEVAFMKKKGAPKSMIRHEEAEMEHEGKKVRKFADGGSLLDRTKAAVAAQRAARAANPPAAAPSMPVPDAGKPSMQERMAASRQRLDALKQKNAANRARVDAVMAKYPVNRPAGMKKGGKADSYRKAADGVAHKGKTKGHVVKMREGGMAYSSGGSVYRRAADGITSKGKTKGKMVKMNKGGYC